MTFFLFLIPPNFGLFGNHGFWSTVCIFLFRWCWWIPELFFLTCIRCWMCLKGSNKSLRKTHTHTAITETITPRVAPWHPDIWDHPIILGSIFSGHFSRNRSHDVTNYEKNTVDCELFPIFFVTSSLQKYGTHRKKTCESQMWCLEFWIYYVQLV